MAINNDPASFFASLGQTNTPTPSTTDASSFFSSIQPTQPTITPTQAPVQKQVTKPTTNKASDFVSIIKQSPFQVFQKQLVGGAKTLPGMAKTAAGIILKNFVDVADTQNKILAPAKAILGIKQQQYEIDKQLSKKTQEIATSLREQGVASQKKAIEEYSKTVTPSKGIKGIIEQVVFNLPQVAASTGLSLATALITKNPALATAIGASTSYGMGASEVYTEAKNQGVSDTKALSLSTIGGIIIGALDFLPLERLLRKTGAVETVKKSIIKKVAQGLTSTVVQSGFEGVTEAAQEIIGNAISMTYNENQDLFEGATEAGLVGAILGGVTGGTLDTITGITNKGSVEEKVKTALQTPKEERTEEQNQIVDALFTKELTPDEVMDYVTKNDLTTTQEGKDLMLAAVKAKQEDKIIRITPAEDEKSMEITLSEPSPLPSSAERIQEPPVASEEEIKPIAGKSGGEIIVPSTGGEIIKHPDPKNYSNYTAFVRDIEKMNDGSNPLGEIKLAEKLWGNRSKLASIQDIPIKDISLAERPLAVKPKPGRKITEPIEVTVIDGKPVLVDGRHRLDQAIANGETTIKAKVSGGEIGKVVGKPKVSQSDAWNNREEAYREISRLKQEQAKVLEVNKENYLFKGDLVKLKDSARAKAKELNDAIGKQIKIAEDATNILNTKVGGEIGKGESKPIVYDQEKIEGYETGKPKQYPTIHEGGKIKMVEGIPVKIVDGVDTFLREGDGGWVVSEATTGRYISDSRSKGAAIAKADTIISQNKEKFIQAIKEKPIEGVSTVGEVAQKRVDELKAKQEKTKEEEIQPKEKIESKENIPSSEQPIGTGTQKNSRLFERVKLTLGAEYESQEIKYNQLSLDQQAKDVVDLVINDPEKAAQIANGVIESPPGMTRNAVSIAIADLAREKGDFVTAARLWKNTSLRSTRLGQEIASLKGEFVQNETLNAVKMILDLRMEQALKKYNSIIKGLSVTKKDSPTKKIDALVEHEAKKLKKELTQQQKRIQSAQEIINSLRC